jgi:hypothetical protein
MLCHHMTDLHSCFGNSPGLCPPCTSRCGGRAPWLGYEGVCRLRWDGGLKGAVVKVRGLGPWVSCNNVKEQVQEASKRACSDQSLVRRETATVAEVCQQASTNKATLLVSWEPAC